MDFPEPIRDRLSSIVSSACLINIFCLSQSGDKMNHGLHGGKKDFTDTYREDLPREFFRVISFHP
jgi:hypothetical protein